jgi:hypothetical protein
MIDDRPAWRSVGVAESTRAIGGPTEAKLGTGIWLSRDPTSGPIKSRSRSDLKPALQSRKSAFRRRHCGVCRCPAGSFKPRAFNQRFLRPVERHPSLLEKALFLSEFPSWHPPYILIGAAGAFAQRAPKQQRNPVLRAGSDVVRQSSAAPRRSGHARMATSIMSFSRRASPKALCVTPRLWATAL